MQVSLLSQSFGLCLGLRRSSELGGAAGVHARVMHKLLGTGRSQGLMEGVDCLVALLAVEYLTARDGIAGYVTDTVWLWRDRGMKDPR